MRLWTPSKTDAGVLYSVETSARLAGERPGDADLGSPVRAHRRAAVSRGRASEWRWNLHPVLWRLSKVTERHFAWFERTNSILQSTSRSTPEKKTHVRGKSKKKKSVGCYGDTSWLITLSLTFSFFIHKIQLYTNHRRHHLFCFFKKYLHINTIYKKFIKQNQIFKKGVPSPLLSFFFFFSLLFKKD